MSNGTEPWEFGNTGGAGEPDPFLTYDPVQLDLHLNYDITGASDLSQTRLQDLRLVKDKGPRIDTRPFAEPLKIKEEDNIPCDCGTCAEEKQLAPDQDARPPLISFEQELKHLLNKYSMESDSNTPDFILAEYMHACLVSFNVATRAREHWYGRRVF